jgi:amino acid transporter
MVDGGVAAMIVFAFGAFAGFEATTIYSEEARDPRRTIPRATYLALAFLALFYAFICWIVVMAFGPSGVVPLAAEQGPTMVFDATDTYLGGAAKAAMDILIVTSLFASILAFHNCAARYFFALGREALVPSWLARVDAETGAPRHASVVVTALSTVVVGAFAIAGADPVVQLLLWVTGQGVLCIVVLQAICAIAVIGYFRRARHVEVGLWASLIAPVISAAGLVAMVVLIVDHFDLLTGATTATNLAIMLCIPAVFLIGMARALWLRRNAPAAYEHLTTVVVEDDPPSRADPAIARALA